MKPAFAKTVEDKALEDLGRATLQIVHDLKNQLNGLKLYATYLRKRLDRDERTTEERETVAKLISGIDRAAREMTALVRYSQPVELRRQPGADLGNMISGAVKRKNAQPGSDKPVACKIDGGPLYGEFDQTGLSEALEALTDEAVNSLPSHDVTQVSLRAHRAGEAKSPQALIEWRGCKLAHRSHSFRADTSYGSVYVALAARVIEAHGGRLECDASTIRAWLPLSE
jgi:signal transduction histidine kinase